MHTGSIIDFYDDPNGFVLREKIPAAGLPEFVKEASFLDEKKRASLPDDVFAVVMVDQGESIRKFACVDKGNTALSVVYFMENHHKLPEGAQKVAAANLVTACGWYDIEPPEQLQKIAGMLGNIAKVPMRAMNAVVGTSTVKGAVDRGAARHAAQMGKVSELSGTRIMPNQSGRPEDEEKTAGIMMIPVNRRNPTPDEADASVKALRSFKDSTGILGRALPIAHVERALRDSAKEKKGSVIQPYVDITGQSAPVQIQKVASQRTLLNGGFPVDTYGEVKQAQQWFGEHGTTLHPADRREYCTKLAARADELGISLDSPIAKYAGQGYAPSDEIELAVSTRLQFWTEDSPERDLLKGLMEKRASLEPGIFCEALRQIDEMSDLHYHWDQGVVDPWFATFGKTAGTDWTFEYGGDRIDEEMLTALILGQRDQVKKLFGGELAEEMAKKPREIFDSLPLDSKRIIMRMANDPQP